MKEKEKEKIAFVVIRYGKDINGGAEQHCRMLAEHLSGQYDTEVLTTCVRNYRTGGNEFPEGTETINGVLVRRFAADITDTEVERAYTRKAKPARRTRQFLFRACLLPLISRLMPIWKPGLVKDEEAQKHSRFYSSGMVDYIRENKDRYKAFIAFTVDYAPFWCTAMEAGEKAIAIPTLHNAKISFRPSLTEAFSRYRYTAFNTPAEKKLADRIFGKAIGASGIIGCGIEADRPAPWDDVKAKYCLPDRYILYLGRVDNSKTGKILSFWSAYRKTAGKEALPLVLAGGIYDSPGDLEGIICTGYVDDSEKRSILQHASLFINPSYYESLSLVVLEALNDRVPVLVNGRCAVLKEHCIRSRGGLEYYMDRKDFIRKVSYLTSSEANRSVMADKGKEYYEANYSWETVVRKFADVIEKI